MTTGPVQLFVSPPMMATPKASAISRKPRYSSSARARPPRRGKPTLTTAATGTPAMAAMSLRFTAMALRPTRRGPASSRRKQLPSSSMSVVTRHGVAVGQARMAVSSPGPSSTRSARGRAPPQPVDEGKFAPGRIFVSHEVTRDMGSFPCYFPG